MRDLAAVRVMELDRVAGEDLEALLDVVDRVFFDCEMDGPPLGLVGISCWTSMHYLGALAVAHRVRELAPNVPIVIGGHHATALPSDFDSSVCDWVVRHDGEAPLRRLCSEWPARPPAMGIIEGGVFDQTSPDHIDWDHYGGSGARGGALWIGPSRGCAFKCDFCVEPGRGASYSRYSVEAQLGILQRLVERVGPRAIAFSDPLFGSNRAWLMSFLDGLERLQLPVSFWCETRADLMSPETLEGFKRCGFMVDFGLDTASPLMIARMHKAARAETYLARARETFDTANRIGLHHGIYLVFNFPGETPETTRETMDWVDAIGNGGDPARPLAGWLSCQTFFILPGTEAWHRMADDHARHGTEIAHPAWWKESGEHHALATQVLPHRAWRGRETELRAFQAWNEQVNAAWSSRYAPEVAAFRHRFLIGADPSP